MRPNLLHVTDYGIGLCLQLLDVVQSSLGYTIREVKFRRMEKWPAHMHQLLSSSSGVLLRALVPAGESLGTVRVSAGAKDRRWLNKKAAVDSHSSIGKGMVV